MVRKLIQIFLTGLAIVCVAIGINILATGIGITTWYPLLDDAAKVGFYEALHRTSPLSQLFLLVVYPFVLGLTAHISSKLLK